MNATSTVAPESQRKPVPWSPVKLSSVCHPSDFSAGDKPAFVHALKIAFAAGGELRLLHVGSGESGRGWNDFPQVRATLQGWAGGPNESDPTHGFSVTKVSVKGRNRTETIEKHLHVETSNLLVLATHQRHGLDRLAHEPVAEKVARHAHVPALFVPRNSRGFVDALNGRASLRRILIPVETGLKSYYSMKLAISLSALLDCREVEFHLIHVGADVPPSVMEKIMSDLVVPWERPGWGVRATCEQGKVVEEIVKSAAADQTDLIVMATQGHKTWLEAIRGSTTELVLRKAPCALLAVPS